MVSQESARLEAFKRAVERSQARRSRELEERRRLSQELGERLQAGPRPEAPGGAAARSLGAQQDRYWRESRRPVLVSDFAFEKVIGAGAFGIVRLCRRKSTGEAVALKQMSKAEMVRKNKVHHVLNEKEALSAARSDWVIGLHCTFQDEAFLYMAMDYLPGGDLITHLQRKGRFSEPETRFYIAELVEAVDYVHSTLRYIHRDIKPDNVLLDAQGHLRLVDFGLCRPDVPQACAGQGPSVGPTLLGTRSPAAAKGSWHPPRAQARSLVGTPDYAAPEVYQRDACCGRECDWWSVGVVMFEMLFGRPPFSDERHDPKVISARVVRWRQYLRLPQDAAVGGAARDLVCGLVCDARDRLAAAEIRRHAFFGGLDFARLRQMEPPIRPVVRGPLDASNFDDFAGEEEDERYSAARPERQAAGDPSLCAFRDYGYRRDLDSLKPSVAAALGPSTAIRRPCRATRLAELLLPWAALFCSPKLLAVAA